jgi:biopolymer transport protein ExbD
MIDMVFLLLVFFMVTAKQIPLENDINLGLPGSVSQEDPVDIPDEQRIVIDATGRVVLNDLTLAEPGDAEMPSLVSTLTRFREAAENAKSKALVTLDPHDTVPHQRLVDVMGACNRAGIEGLTFAGGGGAP